MISNIFEKNILKIAALFLISPGSRYSRKDIKEKTKMNNVPLDNSLNKLLSLGVLRQEKGLLILNPESGHRDILEKLRKEFAEMSLPLDIYILVTEISNRISEIRWVKKAYLFGSYAKLIYSGKSDVDIAVVFSNRVKNINKSEKMIEKEINKIRGKNRKEIELHFFLEKDMKAKDPLIKDILKNGKELI